MDWEQQLLAQLKAYWDYLNRDVDRIPVLPGQENYPLYREGDEALFATGYSRMGPASQAFVANPDLFNNQFWNIPGQYDNQGNRLLLNTLDRMPEYDTAERDWMHRRPRNPRQM